MTLRALQLQPNPGGQRRPQEALQTTALAVSLCRTSGSAIHAKVIVPELFRLENRTRSETGPPCDVVPNRLPLLSTIRASYG